MPNDWFRFKNFLVKQERCAMKVGTDGVLLGAWCQPQNCSLILDAGTGTGIIALMCAQRSGGKIIAVELDKGAASQARENFASSPWAGRLELIWGDIRNFSIPDSGKFDLIVCNPPYFKNSVPSNDSSRSLARHDPAILLDEMIERFIQILSPTGSISMIMPPGRFEEAQKIFLKNGFCLVRKTNVSSRPGTEVIRVLAEWRSTNEETINDLICIYEAGSDKYHNSYSSLTKDFYLGL